METAFLWKWWLQQNEKRRELMRSLINEGRLEIISGGWSMNDEAATHYHSMIDQYTWGFRYLSSCNIFVLSFCHYVEDGGKLLFCQGV